MVYAVSAEDHYLRVHTSAGETMILMRLADAVRELAALEGLQTHRSWWVAKQGLADVSRGDGKVTLKLKSGVEAPGEPDLPEGREGRGLALAFEVAFDRE